MSNCMDPDQDGLSVGPDLGPTVCKGYQQMTKVVARKEVTIFNLHTSLSRCPCKRNLRAYPEGGGQGARTPNPGNPQ